jgi:hypothetical protein
MLSMSYAHALRSPPVEGPDSGLYAAQLAAMSVIVVYHLFVIQTWVQIAFGLESEMEALKRTSLPGDLDREEAVWRVTQHLKRYPWFTVVVLICVVSGLGALAILIGVHLPGVSALFTVTPACLLDGTIIVATAGGWLQGRNALARARRNM